MISKNASSFDAAVANYDTDFTFSEIGKKQRGRVYHWLEKINFFSSSKKVFEINCGTGYDAEQFLSRGHEVIATDVSSEMINYAKDKRNEALTFYTLDFLQLKKDENFEKSEVLFSNFGGLNCLNPHDLNNFFKDVATVQKQGDFFIGVFMAKHCLMEDIYHFLTLKWQKINRRNTSEALKVNVNKNVVNTYYYSPSELIQAMGENYKVQLKKPIAFFLPPSYLEPFFKKNLWLLKGLNYLERIFGGMSFLASYSDHYIIVAKKI